MMNLFFIRGLAVVVLLLFTVVPLAAEPAARALEPLSIETTSGGVVAFGVEIADTPESRRLGLMYREQLPADQGMLFTFDRVEHASFWMKNTPLPLDMIFIEADGRIVKIAHRTTPFSRKNIKSGVPVAAVLEINAGLSNSLGIGEGDFVRHPFFEPLTPE
ncbi:MAG: DUF192 domain-containing protein [Alphaproteobacteria bacterium]